MNHTKGPWFFEESDFTIRTKDFTSEAGLSDYKGIIIAELDAQSWRLIRPDSIPEKTANGKLIAKAPDLFDICQEIVATAELHVHISDYLSVELSDVLDRMRSLVKEIVTMK